MKKASTLIRLDKLLVDRHFAQSRDAAKELIESGRVRISGFVQQKPSSLLSPDAALDIEQPDDDGSMWVSRGAYKLLKALDEWNIDPSGLDCLDIGASTGGFTQVLLSRGAARVAAVDVGYGQLAWVLRNDARVRVLERTNARYVTCDDIGWLSDLLTIDASFISLRLLLPNMKGLLKSGGRIVALVKPQFEAGRGKTNKGVVRDRRQHLEILRELELFVRSDTGLCLSGAAYSPIRGPEGNIEFIFLLDAMEKSGVSVDFEALVEEAHEKTV